MAKKGTHDGRHAKSRGRAKGGGTYVTRDAMTGQFVMGRDAFGKVSEVEGIKLSKRLKADLRELERAPSGKRRSVLSEKYGKR
jgi:hypothetical protein